jgi:hypothetical protein
MTPLRSREPADTLVGAEDAMKKKSEKSAVENGAVRRTRAPKDTLENPHAFYIRISDPEAAKRALWAWLEVREIYHCFPNDEFLVGREHVEVLRKEGIPFEALS